MRIETVAVHAGMKPEPGTRGVTPSIHLATTFERAEDGSYPGGYIYTRNANPNRAMLEQSLAALEGGAAAAAFASGTAAAMSVLQALSPGDHVVAPQDVYTGTTRLLKEVLAPWGLRVSFVDMTDLAQVKKAVTSNTKLVWVETPSNPLLKVTDIAAVAKAAHAAGALCVCDNTWATPALQRPLELGADAVVHATTKYLGGHGDVMGGAAVFKRDDAFARRVRGVQVAGGAIAAPFDCWLVLRGIRTLPLRMRAHSENATKLAQFLSDHSRVTAVHYPGLSGHPGHALAKRQMSMPGGMLSFQVKGGQSAAMKAAARVKLFTRATSLGGTESLIEHRASIEGPQTTTPDDLLRVSVGLEHPDDLIADLEQALG
ncbi:MAG: aminotransferase class V-fold PLP-dependent enzyme [SAR202 cluster bacterium]|nr:aminotransferase class V-fold PLP-dependent enzyme [SAR202 cluster bacterium]